MIRTLALNPFVGIQIAALPQTLLLVGLILGLDMLKSQKSPIIWILQGLAAGLYTIFGLLFLDIGLLWLAGAWTYADWRFQLPSVVLILILGFYYLVRSMFAHGRVVNIAFVICVSVVVGLFLHWWVPQFEVMGVPLESYLVIIIAAFVIAIIALNIILNVLARRESNSILVRSLWDIETPLRKVYRPTVHVILWGLAVSQGILTYLGYSLLSF